MSDETSNSQDPEARRRRRRRRRGPRADAAGGAGGERPERAPRAQAAAEPAGERAGDGRRRRRRRRRPREEGETPEQAAGEAREPRESREPREAADGAGRGTRRSRLRRRRGARPTGSVSPEARDGQGASDERSPQRRARRFRDRVDPSAGGAGPDAALEAAEDDASGRDDAGDAEDRRRVRAAAASESFDRDRDEDDADDEEDEYGADEDEDGEDLDSADEDDEEDDEDDEDDDELDAAVPRRPASESDAHDSHEHERARQLDVVLRRADEHERAEAVPHAIDAGDSEREEEISGVWSADEVTGVGADDDPLPALPVPESAHYEEPPSDDPDPVTWILDQSDEEPEDRALDRPVHNVVGVKFSPAGRIYSYDAGDEPYARGEEVMVDTERGVRSGVVAVTSVRKVHGRGELRQVLRRPNAQDRRAAERNQERCQEALHIARDIVRDLALPMKVFRAEYGQSGKKATVYFTSEERVDFRDLVRDLSKRLRCRVEMRQTGVRDEAKQVGGIGSCGRELCCTTWLPEFVPVSIKMAKDQGLVLNPTKVSGQCGRLKCCLVYEEETYAALRKGLPKLGKRVITEEGEEGRVVEVDVLRQRVRVALGPGEFRVLATNQIRPMFPSQAPKNARPPK